jgi:ribonuclease HII
MPRKPTYLIGIDEVGRGPLAGPVTLCAFAVKIGYKEDVTKIGAKDSKKLSPQKREAVAEKLKTLRANNVCCWAIASSSAHIIDRKGINHAIELALARCLKDLNIHPEDCDIYLDGGLKAPISYFRQHTIIHGDDLYPVISCASILAKVHRDSAMEDHDLKFPEYGFFDNKGYGTPAHIKAIKKHGPSPLHRLSFCSSFLPK